jgi:hypothetical protein
MIEKSKKTEAELQSLIMQEVRKRPEFRCIQDVAITRPVQLAPHLPNWGYAWVVEGAGLRPREADAIPEKLQREYDLG